MCGWLSASKVLGMKLKNMTGYMLGNSNNVHCVGSAWSDVDCRVWVCATLDKAKRVLAESQRMCGLEPHVVWETIYQVSAKDIVFKHVGMHVNKNVLIIAHGNVVLIVVVDAQIIVHRHVQVVQMNVVKVVQIIQCVMHVMDVHLKVDAWLHAN